MTRRISVIAPLALMLALSLAPPGRLQAESKCTDQYAKDLEECYWKYRRDRFLRQMCYLEAAARLAGCIAKLLMPAI